MQTNRGVYVTSVVDGTSAYESDILPGDVIVALNGQTANGIAGLTELIGANRGRSVEIAIIRAGKPLTKRVSLPE
jgi:S1-C subfamily serine protease